MRLRGGREDFVPGRELLDIGRRAPFEELAGALGQWAALVRALPEGLDEIPLDLVPHNVKALEDGSLRTFDQEWFMRSADTSAEDVVRRGVLWFAARLVLLTPPSRWEGHETVRDVVVLLGTTAGLDPDGAWIEPCILSEARIQATVVRHSSQVAQEVLVAEHVADLRGVLAGRLRDLGLGERLHESAARVSDSLARSGEAIAQLEGLSTELNSTIGDLHGKLGDLRAAASTAEQRAAEAVESAEGSAADAARQAERAARAELDLAVLLNSRAHKVSRRYYDLVDRVAPAGTRRRGLYSGALRSAVSTARAVTARKLPPVAPPTVVPVSVPTSSTPRVSVVVPVHGKWDYTERCLRALSETRGDIPFEVIVVDDASPDDSRARLASVAGVRVVALDVNQGYVGACNAGIEAATGELVVLLNNDTRGRPGLARPLVDALRRPDDRPRRLTAGLPGRAPAGGRRGHLRRRLGLELRQGRRRRRRPVRYRRDVDYCSGASIMLRPVDVAASSAASTRASRPRTTRTSTWRSPSGRWAARSCTSRARSWCTTRASPTAPTRQRRQVPTRW